MVQVRKAEVPAAEEAGQLGPLPDGLAVEIPDVGALLPDQVGAGVAVGVVAPGGPLRRQGRDFLCGEGLGLPALPDGAGGGEEQRQLAGVHYAPEAVQGVINLLQGFQGGHGPSGGVLLFVVEAEDQMVRGLAQGGVVIAEDGALPGGGLRPYVQGPGPQLFPERPDRGGEHVPLRDGGEAGDLQEKAVIAPFLHGLEQNIRQLFLIALPDVIVVSGDVEQGLGPGGGSGGTDGLGLRAVHSGGNLGLAVVDQLRRGDAYGAVAREIRQILGRDGDAHAAGGEVVKLVVKPH